MTTAQREASIGFINRERHPMP